MLDDVPDTSLEWMLPVVSPLERASSGMLLATSVRNSEKVMRFRPLPALFAALSLLAASFLYAQDTRTVTEPKIPPACITLEADVAANHGVIAEADEQKLSTARIQDALDHCGQGASQPASGAAATVEQKSVVLRAHGKKNVFITGPLTLRSGVILVVDKNTALVGSRDPRVYDLTPGGCGIVAQRGRGCKPLISGADVTTLESWARAPLTRVAARIC